MTPSLGPGETDGHDLVDPDDLTPWRKRRPVHDPNVYEDRQEIPDPDGYRWPDE